MNLNVTKNRNKWIDAQISSIQVLTQNTRKFTIQFNEKFDFIPGQFIQIKLNNIVRSYSIASYSLEKNKLELIIVKVEDGKLTPILFNDTVVGDKIQVRGPKGKFILPDDTQRDIFFICTGTGLAPFKSILDHLNITQKFPRNLYLIFGTRTKQDLLFYEEISEIEQNQPHFNYIPVLSRQEWDGSSGYVHKEYKEIINNSKPKDPLFYLCGWKNMVSEAKQNILDFGYNRKNIKLEVYG